MGYTNGIIKAPIDIRDVKAVLDETPSSEISGDVDYGDVFLSPNINKWAKYKPVISSKDDVLTDEELHQLSYGLSWSGTANLSSFAYERPTDTFRASDFTKDASNTESGYNHYAPCGFCPKEIQDYNIVSQTENLIITNNDDETCVTFCDVRDTLFSAYSGVRLQLLAYDARTDYSYTSDAVSMNTRTISFSVPKSVLKNLNVGKVAARFVFNNGSGSIMVSPVYTFFDIVGVEDVLELTNAWDGSTVYPKIGGGPTGLTTWTTYRAGMSTTFLDITNKNLYMEFGLRNLTNSAISSTSVSLLLTWTNENNVPVYSRSPLYFYTGSITAGTISAKSELSGTFVAKNADIARIGTKQTVTAVLQYNHPTAGYISFGNKINLNLTRTSGSDALDI